DPPGPIARWKMDEGSGTTITDCAQFGNTGTLNNGVAWTTGQTGGGLSFDGTNDYVRVTRTTTLEPAAFTVSTWVKRNGTQATWANIARKTYQNNTGPSYVSWSLQLN